MANIYVRSTDGNDADTGATWALAKATLSGALAIATSADTIWVSQNHAETQASNMTLTLPTTVGLKILCGNDAAEPPTALATTATITVTGNFTMSFASGYAYFYGIGFVDGSGGSGSSDITIAPTSSVASGMIFESCKMTLVANNSSAALVIGGSQTGSGGVDIYTSFINSSFKFANAAQGFVLRTARIRFQNISLDGAGTAPTSLFSMSNGFPDSLLIENSNLTGVSFTNLFDVGGWDAPSDVVVRNCKLPSGVAITTGTFTGAGGLVLKVHNCDSADTHIRFAEHSYQGSVVQQTSTRIRTGGATQADGTAFSWLVTGNANAENLFKPLISPEIAIYNTSLSAMTVTVEILRDSVTNLQNDEIWLEVDYYGTTGFPLGTRISTRMTDVLSTPADVTDSSATWDTTGMTNPNTQKLVTASFTPAEAGYIIVKVMIAKNTTLYVDPLITLA